MQPSALAHALPRSDTRPLAMMTLTALLCLLLWDAAGQDLWLAQAFGSSNGFALRDHWLFLQVMHEGARRLAWLVLLALTIGIWWPFGVLRSLHSRQRVQLVISALAGLVVINVLKYGSTSSCPWDLQEFGGVARYVSHWALGVLDGGSGRCFPAGHASAGFAFVGGFFALRHSQPLAARWWLLAAISAGLALGLAQQVRGAHFMSHTLWTGWLCWCAAWLCDLVARQLPQRATA
ncbi:phosphatase PAP2 family protein [Giesbergeria anulus]|uniref:Membrane-associated enzyme, PAP2 (Acid phosphatase) superfamily n=1 Tax=Giesbergeria anulus TaxID=180197 RepID=A0A1H9M9F6_9BURK|nr:phosphatase PAP2 family protein [Burkholderiaceae bacterium]SER20282.1 Membrane-associated enzyme, PAP2 (acid phosphatase) superfamily [Giesbergeria anulus]